MKRTQTGIPGLDEITGGGFPANRLVLIVGDAGAGKTILAMQYLMSGVADFDEPGIVVSFEERVEELCGDIDAFGWRCVSAASLAGGSAPKDAVIAIDAVPDPDTVYDGAFDIKAVLGAVTAAAGMISAKRVVFDGLDVVLDFLPEPQQRRREVARLAEWARAQGLSVIVTAKKTEDSATPDAGGYGFLKYVSSCAISLEAHKVAEHVERVIRVLKVRGSTHSSSDHPYVIRSRGITIGDVGSTRLSYHAPNEHVSSGIERLDAMLGGGYFRASGVLISGAPGTAKSTLAGAFVNAACLRNERSLMISFDETFSQIERNLDSVNIALGRHVKSGLLATAGFRTGRLGAEEHFHQIMDLINAHSPKILVIDPISALNKVVGEDLAGDMVERLLDQAKLRGITMMITSLLGGASLMEESTRVQVSSIADTWIQLSFSMIDGERNRALTIIKSRGNAHSNQIRELVLSSAGLDLKDVYALGGAVLMGTARMERELADLAEANRFQREASRRRGDMEQAQARLRAQINELQREMEALEGQQNDWLQDDAEQAQLRELRQRRLMERVGPTDRGPDASLIR